MSASSDQHDVEQKIDHAEVEGLSGGSALSRQLSVQLTNSRIERLYLEPGGLQSKGDLTKRFGNPTALGLGSFLLCLTPVSAMLLGWNDTSVAGLAVMSGPAYFIGGIGLYLAAIFEFILGNTYTFTVFGTFGGFWMAFGYFLQPTQAIAEAAGGAASIAYNNGFAMYLSWWTAITIVYGIASLRTNLAFVSLFAFLTMAFILLTVVYLRIGYGITNNLTAYLQAAGAFSFLTCCSGWYIFVALIFGSTGFPISLPLGDLSGFLVPKPKSA